MKRISLFRRGQIIIQVIVFGSIAVFMLTALTNWSLLNSRSSRDTFSREQALQVAEAGIDYYRWHLAHAPTDFQDGTGVPGPYFHNFFDKDNNLIGQFSLTITPPLLGSTKVTVRSIGTTTLDARVSRSITAQFAKPSIAKYAVVANNIMRFGIGTVITGEIHSNQGIRFDGLAQGEVTSAVISYLDPDHQPLPAEFGVHTHVAPVDPLPPAAIPPRTDVFAAGRQTGVGVVDFDLITFDLAVMRTAAQANGFYRANSGSQGYHVVLLSSDTFNLFRVTSLVPPPTSQCTNTSPPQPGWGTWSIQTETLLGNYPMPVNGIIFLEDHVFVNGLIDGARVNIIAASIPLDPLNPKNIIVNSDLLYTLNDGSDVIGLIAQGNMNVGMVSQDILRIDAAIIAQNGRVGRHYYRAPGGSPFSLRCSPYHVRNTLTLWGMIATNKRYGFAYTDGTGYTTRNIMYDGNLLYEPPPSFPLTSDQYKPISWEEN